MHKTTYKINGGTSVNSYVASNIHILSVWLPLLTSNILLICHAVYVDWMWWLFTPLYYIHVRGELWLKHVRDFTCKHNLLFYINCVYLVVCMGDNSVISVVYLSTKFQTPSADGSSVISLKKLKKENYRNFTTAARQVVISYHAKKFTMFYHLQRSALGSTGSGITLAYPLVRHIVTVTAENAKTVRRILHWPSCLPSYVTSDRRKQVIFWVTPVRSLKPATYKLLWQHSISTVSALTYSPKDGSRYKPQPSSTFKTKDSVPHNHVTMNCSLSRSAENDQKPVTHTSHITWQGIKPGLLHVMTSSNQPGTIRDTSWTQLSRFWEQDMGRTAERSLSLPKWKPKFSFRQHVDSRSGGHPATYSIGTENPFGAGKAAVAWT